MPPEVGNVISNEVSGQSPAPEPTFIEQMVQVANQANEDEAAAPYVRDPLHELYFKLNNNCPQCGKVWFAFHQFHVHNRYCNWLAKCIARGELSL